MSKGHSSKLHVVAESLLLHLKNIMGSKISSRAGLPQDVKFSKCPPSIQTSTTSDEKTRISSDNLSSSSSKSIEVASPTDADTGPVQPFQYMRRLDLTRAVPEHTIRLSSPSLHDLQTTTAMNDLLSLCETGSGASVSQLLESNQIMKDIINDYHDCHVEDRHMNITPLMLAAACGHAHVIEELLLAPCVLIDLESGDSYGQTALHIAVSLGQLKCIQAFVACQNVDINARDNLQMTPLHIATYGRFDEAVELLLGRHDIDCGLQDSNGNNVFHIGALSNNVNAVKSIIKHTCMVDYTEICRYGDLSPSEDLSDVRKPTMGETLRHLTEVI